MDDDCIVISDSEDDEGVQTEYDIDSKSLASDESHKDDDVGRDLPSTSNGRVTVSSGCGKGHIKQKVTSLAGKDGVLDSESEVQAEEQPSGIGEKKYELDGDYNAEGQSRNQTHHNEPGNISGEGSKGNGMTLEDLWMESQSHSQVEPVEFKFENMPWDLADFNSQDVQTRKSPLPQGSSPGLDSSVHSPELLLPQVSLPGLARNQTHQNKPGNISRDVSDASDSKGNRMTLGDLWKESQSYSQVEAVEYKFEDRLSWDTADFNSQDVVQSPKSPLPQVSSAGSASSVLCNSETDSDETCIEDDDLDLSPSQDGSIKSEHPSSDETKIDSNDGDDHGRTENMSSDEMDEEVINETTEGFNTQPFSPILDDETEDSLSDASEEFPTSETIIPRDSPSHLEDKEHDGTEAAGIHVEPEDLYPSDSHISCQSPDEEIHRPQRDDALSVTLSCRSNVNSPLLQREGDSNGKYFPTDSQLCISLDNEDTEELTTQQPQQKPLEDDSLGQYFPTDSQLSSSLNNEDTEELTTQQPQQDPLEDDSLGQYFPSDSQLSISLDNEDTEELTTQQPQQDLLENDSPGQYFPTDSQLSINLDNEDTKEIVNQHEKRRGEEAQSAMSIPSKPHSSGGVSEDLNNNNRKKNLPCQQNAWSPSELHPQERFLLLQVGESEPVSSFLQVTPAMPSSPSMAPSTYIAAPGNLVPTRNEKHIPKLSKQNKSFRRPSRSDKLLSTMKESDQGKEKNPIKMTNSLQDIPDTQSKPLSLSLKNPTDTPSASMICSVQDCLQQPASLNSNEMGLEDEIPADPRNLSHGHLSVPSLSFPTRSSYSNISESSSTLIGGHAASSGTSETPTTKPDRVKPTDDRSACPGDPPNPSLVASDISKPLKKRRHSQTSSILSGNQGTEPSKVTRITNEFKQEDALSCVLSWNADWFDKHKEVHSAEILQSFLMGKEVPRNKTCYPDVRSYQEAFICFLLLEMWSNVSSSVAKDCDRTWRQNSRENKISQDIVEVQYEAADVPMEPHDLSVGDLVLIDMPTDTASEKQFNFGLVHELGLSDRTISLALHKSIIVPSSTRIKVVTSLSHYLNQIRALLSFSSNPLARHIIKPEDYSVFVKDPQVNAEGSVSDVLLKSYMESITSHASRSEVIRLMDGAAGTGKTGFLCRLVRRIAREHKKVRKTLKNSYKLLVCAPTNQSLDVLLRKIWQALKDNREAMKHIVDGVEIVRVNKTGEADLRLTEFLLSSVVASKRKQGSPYDKLSEDALQTKILQEADIVGCTLHDSGLEIVRSSLAGNVFALFVDDAGHCLETEILLALQCKTKRVFLAGDQEQGIVSIRSKEARALGFGHSMLERLAENFEIEDRCIHKWEVQYRMKEDIAKYPSSFMYHGLETRVRHFAFCLRPYIIFDVADGKESLHRDSVVNISEVSFIEVLVSGFLKLREPFTVGIITPSEGQKGKLLERLQGKRIPGLLVGTPTSFYGLEKDVIILCCTSTSRTPNENGFVMNKQVLNLALTRSKWSLIIVGNMKSLQKMSSIWKSLVDDATGRQLVFRTSQASYSKDAKECHSKDPKDSLNVKPDRNVAADNRGKRRVHSDPGTEDNGRAAKVQRSCDSIQGESSSGKSFGGSCHLSPSSRDPVQPPSTLKKPDGNVAATSHDEDRGVDGHQVHHNLLSHSRSVASTAPGISASSSSTCSPQRQRRRNSSGLDPSLDTEDGNSLHAIATGMRDNERLPRQQKGQIIAGHTVGKRKPQSSRRTETIEHGRRERRPSGELTGEGTSQHRNSSNGNETRHNQSRDYQQRRNGRETGQNQSHDHQQLQNRSDRRPQHQYHQRHGEVTGAVTPQRRNSSNGNETGQNQSRNYRKHQNRTDGRPQHQSLQQQRSSERREHFRNERRPSSEATGTGTFQRRKGSIGNEAGQNQSRDYQQWGNRSDQRPQHQYHQQQVCPERQEHVGNERRPSGEATVAGTSQRWNDSNGNEMGNNESRDCTQQQNWSDRRPQQWRRQRPQPYPERWVQQTVSLNQHDNNPVQLDQNMLHERTFHDGRITVLTKPRPNIRRGKLSNSVKERQMNNNPY